MICHVYDGVSEVLSGSRTNATILWFIRDPITVFHPVMLGAIGDRMTVNWADCDTLSVLPGSKADTDSVKFCPWKLCRVFGGIVSVGRRCGMFAWERMSDWLAFETSFQATGQGVLEPSQEKVKHDALKMFFVADRI